MWKRLNRKEIFKHPRITLLEDKVELTDGRIIDYLTFAHTNDSVTIIAQDGDKMLLSREYSYPMDTVLDQFPGGKLEVGEDPAQAAKRELQEETGYQAGALKMLGWYYVNNRRTEAKMYVILATGLRYVKKEGGDVEEDIESAWTPISEINEKIKSGQIVNFSALAAWSLFNVNRV